MIKGKLFICNGKKYKRSYFHTMREVDFRIFMVKLCQGRPFRPFDNSNPPKGNKKGIALLCDAPNLFKLLLFVRLHALNGAVFVVLNLSEHDTTLMVYAAGQRRIVVE